MKAFTVFERFLSKMVGRKSLLLIASLLLSPLLHAQDYIWRQRLSSPILAVGINPLNPNTIYAHPGPMLVSYDKGLNWSSLGSPGGGSSLQILVHPSDTLVIFAVGSGLHRSSDYGLTWTNVLPNLFINGESLALDPIHPDTLFVGNHGDGAVYRSTDRGQTWDLRSHSGDLLCALAVRPDSAQILYVGTGDGTISKSTDAGLTWRLVKGTGSFEIPHISVDPFDPLTTYATAWGGHDSTTGVWKTTDGGEHWSPIGLSGVSTWAMDVDRINPGVVYAGDLGSGLGVFRSADRGLTWDSLSEGLMEAGGIWNLKVHPLDSDIVWIATGKGIYRWTTLLATIQGVVRDAATGDPVTNGFIELISTGERVLLDTSQGTFSLHYYEGDSLLSGAHVEAFPYYISDEGVEFVLDSVITHDIYLSRLPQTTVTGTVEDSITHSPLSADVTITSTTSLGSMNYTTITDPDGFFQFDSLFISYPPIVAYDAIGFKPGFPHAQLVVRPVLLDTIQYVLDVPLDTADVLISSSFGSGDFGGYYGCS